MQLINYSDYYLCLLRMMLLHHFRVYSHVSCILKLVNFGVDETLLWFDMVWAEYNRETVGLRNKISQYYKQNETCIAIKFFHFLKKNVHTK